MVGEKIAKQMLSLQKATVDQSYNAMLVIQDHSEKIMQTVMEQATWLPEGSKQVVDGWIGAAKKNGTDYKQMLDDYFSSVEKFFVTETPVKKSAKPAANTATKPAATKAQ
jgi:hypothetical protein